MEIPEGYVEILYGRIFRSDLVWSPVVKEWKHPTTAPYRPFGDAKGYWCVIRRLDAK